MKVRMCLMYEQVYVIIHCKYKRVHTHANVSLLAKTIFIPQDNMTDNF